MDRLLEAFREGLQEAGLQPGRGVRYPQNLREVAVDYCREAHHGGAPGGVTVTVEPWGTK